MYKLISGPEVDKRLGKSRWSRIRLMKKDPRFPRPIIWAPNSMAWIEEEIDRYIRAKMAERDAQAEQKPE